MKQIVGLLMVAAAVVFGLWAGIWWAFIGGIVDIVEQIRAPDLSAIGIALGVAKVFFAGLIGWAAFALLAIPGLALAESRRPYGRRGR